MGGKPGLLEWLGEGTLILSVLGAGSEAKTSEIGVETFNRTRFASRGFSERSRSVGISDNGSRAMVPAIVGRIICYLERTTSMIIRGSASIN